MVTSQEKIVMMESLLKEEKPIVKVTLNEKVDFFVHSSFIDMLEEQKTFNAQLVMSAAEFIYSADNEGKALFGEDFFDYLNAVDQKRRNAVLRDFIIAETDYLKAHHDSHGNYSKTKVDVDDEEIVSEVISEITVEKLSYDTEWAEAELKEYYEHEFDFDSYNDENANEAIDDYPTFFTAKSSLSSRGEIDMIDSYNEIPDFMKSIVDEVKARASYSLSYFGPTDYLYAIYVYAIYDGKFYSMCPLNINKLHIDGFVAISDWIAVKLREGGCKHVTIYEER